MRRATMNLRALLATLLVAVSSRGAAQGALKPPAAGHGAFQVGYLKLDASEFNAALTSSGYPRLDEGFLTLGGAGYGGPGRWMFGGEGHAIIGSSRATAAGNYELSMNGGYGMFRMGYDLLDREDADIYPSFGIGGGGVGFAIRERSAPTFNDVLSAPGRSSTMSQGGLVVGVALTANYRISLPMKEPGTIGGLLFGATAGYVMNPASSGWRLDGNNSVAGGPPLTLEGWYARFSLGGWGRGPEGR